MPCIRTVFRLKTLLHRMHDHVHRLKHCLEHMIGLNFEVVCLKFNGYVPIAQMVRGPCEVKWTSVVGAMGDF